LKVASSRLKQRLFEWTFDGAGEEIKGGDRKSQPGTGAGSVGG
jgi:hypothetical protein